ncbi:uncharacterized protein PFL1_05053 [Pseudozyma flocculosa PF-1]|uniref:Uncharacterized protein n=1 Tax=Pseudozyma flocculosa PF-1 TaxID=1277687 RepID=A0A061H6B1_9BASI|nr:uncharacterized protein PFL1_05053 [Pseudozyma flocculosa PF-1]EPQ27515.1 hypothetical protein PFL1_05053 [Pseudozyma flocculosa PF-1]
MQLPALPFSTAPSQSISWQQLRVLATFDLGGLRLSLSARLDSSRRRGEATVRHMSLAFRLSRPRSRQVLGGHSDSCLVPSMAGAGLRWPGCSERAEARQAEADDRGCRAEIHTVIVRTILDLGQAARPVLCRAPVPCSAGPLAGERERGQQWRSARRAVDPATAEGPSVRYDKT